VARFTASRLLGSALALVSVVALAACGVSRRPAGRAHASTAAAGASARRHRVPQARTPRVKFTSVTLQVPTGNAGTPLNVPRQLRLPAGWTAEVWSRFSDPRLEAWTPEGDLLVSSPSAGEVLSLAPRADRSAPPQGSVILRGLDNPQGLAFDHVGGREVLYVAESNEVDRYTWSHGAPAARTVLIGNLPDTQPAQDDVHTLKEVVVGPDHTIYVDIGSSSNASPRTSFAGTPRAAVIAYRPSGARERVFATGVRNGDGLAFAPDGTLWTAVNERDQITYPFHRGYGSDGSPFGQVITQYVNDHPPDEVARLTPGRDLGWPYCNPDPDARPGVAGTALDYGDMPFTADGVTNPSSSRMNCAKLAPIQRGLPAHSAPLGFHFLAGSALPSPWSGGAVVAGHGSWDRTPPRPPVIYWMPWEAKARTLGPAIALIGGFQNADGTRWGRPADAIPGPDGALYVTDDTAGAVYRIVPSTR
jgi:glucose/arabinose dehydrogenase